MIKKQLKRLMKKLTLLIGLVFFIISPLAAMNNTESLEALLAPILTLEANFEQTIKNDSGATLQYFSGKVWLKKPGQFRWEVLSDEPRIVISNGKKVWDYDKDLEQVTIQKIRQAQVKAPIFFLTGDIDSLEKDFSIHTISVKKKHCLSESDTCFQLKPKEEDSAFQWIKIGFKHKTLVEMELLDQLGQRSEFNFKDVKTNKVIPENYFEFKPPKGVDVLEGE